MNSLAEIIQRGSLALDALGIVGLGLLVLAALRLARVHQSWGGHVIAAGALAMLIGRMFVVISPFVLTRDVLASLGRTFISAQAAFPVVILTLGLAGIVWGLWGHERWMRESR